MLPISTRPDMNSRATGERSHRRRIRSPAASKCSSLVQSAGQAAKSRIGHHLIPVIENYVERRLAPHGPDDGAEDSPHPHQSGKPSAEPPSPTPAPHSPTDLSQP